MFNVIFLHFCSFVYFTSIHVKREFAKINFRSVVFTAIQIFPSKNIRKNNVVYIITCIFLLHDANIIWMCNAFVTHSSLHQSREIFGIHNGVYKYSSTSWISWLWQHKSKLNWSLHVVYYPIYWIIESKIRIHVTTIEKKWVQFTENWPRFWNVKCSLLMELHYIDANEIEPINANSCKNDMISSEWTHTTFIHIEHFNFMSIFGWIPKPLDKWKIDS